MEREGKQAELTEGAQGGSVINLGATEVRGPTANTGNRSGEEVLDLAGAGLLGSSCLMQEAWSSSAEPPDTVEWNGDDGHRNGDGQRRRQRSAEGGGRGERQWGAKERELRCPGARGEASDLSPRQPLVAVAASGRRGARAATGAVTRRREQVGGDCGGGLGRTL